MIIDKHLKKYLKQTGEVFSLIYLPTLNQWQVTLGKTTIQDEKLAHALQRIWLALEQEHTEN